ncbi:MAG: ubiquitin-conjugating enzyme E2 [Acidobacteriota bacterium]|nr:ubiquitin-conjugating enzyme E2 [Acidobacteriota bacterium]
MTPEELRRERLRNDFKEMQRLDGEVIRLTAQGDAPERYRLLLRVRSIIGPGPAYRDEHEVQVELGPGYPWGPPQITMLTLPPPFHPNWFRDARWCGGDPAPEESLAQRVLRMVRTLQFDLKITNPNSPANHHAADWYRQRLEAQKNSPQDSRNSLFPCDRKELPDPSRPRLQLEKAPEPRRRLELLPDP